MASLVGDLSYETLNQVRELARKAGTVQRGDGIQRDYTTSLGLINYDLQAPAKLIRPFVFVLLNMTPKVPGRGDITTHWKVINGINTTLIEGGVAEGSRNGRITTTLANASAAYATLGLEDDVTWEANWAAADFEDARARMAVNLLYSTKEAEERMLLGGNSSTANGGIALGTPATPTGSTSTSGGAIAASTAYSVKVVALTAAGFRSSSVAAGVVGTISFATPDGNTASYGGGSSIPSAGYTGSTGVGSTNSISASVAPVTGAVAYAWYVGAAGSERIYAITTINSVLITSIPVSGQLVTALPGTDQSTNTTAFTGLIPQAQQFGQVITQATGTAGTGTPLTHNGAGGFVETDNLFKGLWDNHKVSPRYLMVNSQELLNMNKSIISNGGAPLIRFNMDASDAASEIVAGRVVGNMLNQFVAGGGGQLVKLILHPDMPPGTMMALTDTIPGVNFPGDNLGQLWELHTQQDYYQIEWPMRTRAYETGVYVRETLAHYFPASLGLINNIGNGIA